MLCLLAGCAVGPDYSPSAAPDVSAYESTPLPPKTSAVVGHGGSAQLFIPGADISADWWTLYQSPALNRMIDRALQGNPDLAAAEASLRASEESLGAEETALLPTLNGGFSSIRQKTSSASNGNKFPGSIYTVHTASLSVAYNADVFGGTRRAIEQLAAERDAVREQTQAALLTVTSNIVATAIDEASLRAQIEATHAIIHEQQQTLDLLNAQFNAGAVSRAIVYGEVAQLAEAQSTLPPLESQLAITRHRMSVLQGDFPNRDPEGTFILADLHLPETLPVSLPSRLVEQRPDIRAAEAQLHAAEAAIGVSVAARLPQINLTADIGSAAGMIENLFTAGTGLWQLGGSLTQTIFDFGALEHKEGAAKANYDAALAQYRHTVLAAFQDVADILRALQADALTLKAKVTAEKAATTSLELARTQYKAGAINYLTLLTDEQALQQAKLSRVQAEAQRYSDTAALFQALGGGWWNRNKDMQAKQDSTNSQAHEAHP